MPFRVQVVTSNFPGGPGYNTLYTATNDPADVAAWIVSVNTFLAGMASLCTNTTNITRSGTIEEFDPVTGQTTGVDNIAPNSFNGTGTNLHEVAGSCLVLQLRTGQFINGREVRGRLYWSGLFAMADGNGAVPQAQLTDAAGALGDYTGTSFAAVYSRTHGTLRTVTGQGVWNKFGLMRSRRD